MSVVLSLEEWVFELEEVLESESEDDEVVVVDELPPPSVVESPFVVVTVSPEVSVEVLVEVVDEVVDEYLGKTEVSTVWGD